MNVLLHSLLRWRGQGACPCPTLSHTLFKDKDWYHFLPFSASICSLSTWHCPSPNIFHPHGLVSNFPKHWYPLGHPCGKVWREWWWHEPQPSVAWWRMHGMLHNFFWQSSVSDEHVCSLGLLWLVTTSSRE